MHVLAHKLYLSLFEPHRTALILGCEYGCKDAVEVLLKSGIDVKAVDSFGHDAFHYARLSKNTELVAMVKSYLDKATRGQMAKHHKRLNISFLLLFVWNKNKKRIASEV